MLWSRHDRQSRVKPLIEWLRSTLTCLQHYLLNYPGIITAEDGQGRVCHASQFFKFYDFVPHIRRRVVATGAVKTTQLMKNGNQTIFSNIPFLYTSTLIYVTVLLTSFSARHIEACTAWHILNRIQLYSRVYCIYMYHNKKVLRAVNMTIVFLSTLQQYA